MTSTQFALLIGFLLFAVGLEKNSALLLGVIVLIITTVVSLIGV